MDHLIHPVLLCGGYGTRLWPLSRKSYPKQFVPLIETRSLFQEASQRTQHPDFAAPLVITGNDFRFVVRQQLADMGIEPASLLIEPMARNTGVAICTGALAIERNAPGSLMLAMPCDHLIADADHFRTTVQKGTSAAVDGKIVTFGIQPTRPETGYGWLELSEPPCFEGAVQPLKSFIEKPSAARAQELLDGGMHLWNSGIFLFTTTSILEAYATFAPEILRCAQQALSGASMDLGFIKLESDAWAAAANTSIDHAIMENASDLMVVPFDGAWSDLGDWQSMWREGPYPKTDAGLVTVGQSVGFECEDTLLNGTDPAQVLIGVGLKDIVAVAMPDAVLIADKTKSQDLKAAVASMKARGMAQAETLPRDHRPWGWHETLVLGPRFRVKTIVVNPGCKLSLQSHLHRAEHWVVVEGTAKVTIDDCIKLVTEDQSVYIPTGAVHQLENPGKFALTLIEVQTGGYLGEDDITRYDDMYART